MDYKQIQEYKKEILNDYVQSNDMEHAIQEIVSRHNELSTKQKKRTVQALYYELCHYGPIQPYLNDSSISEIMINGLGHSFVEKKGCITPIEPPFHEIEHLRQLIYKIANEVGREVNLSNPILDARLKDGSRVNVIMDPVAIHGPIITIRKFNQAFSTLEDIVASGMVSHDTASFIVELVKKKYNIFICGSTGSGKTTLLNFISQAIPNNERIITIEDAAEICIQSHDHVISLETKIGNAEHHVLNMSHLIKNALRMRPDRVIVGEVRGEEVKDMLQAMNTGHEGSISTGHGNSPMDMLTRLEVIASSNSDLDNQLIRKQIISAIDILIFLERWPNGKRVVQSITEVNKNSAEYDLHEIYSKDTNDNFPLEEKLQNNYKFNRTFH